MMRGKVMKNSKIANLIAKKDKQKIICLTAYSYSIAKILDKYCDLILVGDSLGMTVYGMKDTIDVTIEMMINHAKAVKNAVKNALVVVDLPFGTYENCKDQALSNAQKVIQETNCDAVKIEIDQKILPTLQHLVQNNIAVVGHVGLLPQHVRKIGSYKYQGTKADSANEILAISKEIANLGAFALVIEAVPVDLADKITQSINIPTIGIGASLNCSGQILVTDDLLGLNEEFQPKFVKKYEELAKKIHEAVNCYKSDVINQKSPETKNLYYSI